MRKYILTIIIYVCAVAIASAQSFESAENNSRAFVGTVSGTGMHLSWRMLASDTSDSSFDIYRKTGNRTIKVNSSPITASSEFTDTGADFGKDNKWILKSGRKELASYSCAAGQAKAFIEIPIDKPEARDIFRASLRSFGTTDRYNPGDASDRYTYSAGDCATGDLDGDGEMEIILKWVPSNSSSPDRTGVTGNTVFDAYKMNGTKLWRIDLGPNVRSTFCGTPIIIYDLDGDGKAEVVCKTAEGAVDGQGNIIGNPRADWRSMDEASATFGRTVIGPEFITVFDGQNGRAVDSQKFIPLRFPLNSWGGIGGSDDLGIRSEQYTAGVAYLDGVHPSAFFVRGGDARTVVAAWNFNDGKLQSLWTFDTSSKEWGSFSGNGGPNVSVADFDSDGCDEICVGAMVVDNDGKGLVSTKLRGGPALHAGKLVPSRNGIQVFGVHDNGGAIGAFLETPALAVFDGCSGEVLWSLGEGVTIGRGIAADIDPEHEGAEIWVGADTPASVGGRRPAAGQNPRGMMPERQQVQKYDGPLKGVRSAATGELICEETPESCNFTVFWDADPQSELIDGTKVSKWNWESRKTETLFSAEGVKAVNTGKLTPCFVGDILGDWREEIIWTTADESALRIYVSDIPASKRMLPLTCDRMYRMSLVWQNVGYNQPAHTSFDMQTEFNNNQSTIIK